MKSKKDNIKGEIITVFRSAIAPFLYSDGITQVFQVNICGWP